MNKLFKDIRHSDIEAVQAAILKNISVVNEVYNAKAPKKDIGQSPLQVAIKCGEFEIIELLLENGADSDFMEDPALVPPHSVCMSVLHDAIIGVFSSLCYKQYGHSEKYIYLIEKLLKNIQEITKKRLFEVLDLLIRYGADQEEWLNQNFWGVSNKVHYFEEKMYDINNIDIREPIRIALEEYFN